MFADPVARTTEGVRTIIGALERGRAVVATPPWASTLDDADRVVEAQRRTGRPVLHAEPLCHAPVVVELGRRLGALGPVQRIECRAFGPRRDGDADDLLAVPVALTLLIARRAGLGDVVDVQPLDGPPTPGRPDSDRRVAVRFTSGASAWSTAGELDHRIAELQVSSATGVLRAELFPVPTLEHDGEPVPLPRVSASPAALEQFGQIGQLLALAEALAFGAAPLTDATFGRDVIEVLSRAADPSR